MKYNMWYVTIVVLICGVFPVSVLTAYRELSTSTEWKYKDCFPLTKPVVTFKVKANNDAHFMLTNTLNPDLGVDPYIEIVIGGWSNTQSVIRKQRKEPAAVVAQTPGIVSPSAHRAFWVKLVGPAMVFGKEFQNVPVMSWTDPSPFNMTHYCVCTGWGSSGHWKINDNVDEEVANSPCMPDDVQKAQNPWESDPLLLVKESCYKTLTNKQANCQKDTPVRVGGGNQKKRYVIDDEKTSWDEAKSNCEKKGMRLASVRNRKEQELLDSEIRNCSDPFIGVWIAANDRTRNGEFVWYDGTNNIVSFFNWESKTSSNYRNKDCVFASFVGESWEVKKEAYWNLHDCSDNWNYACETLA